MWYEPIIDVKGSLKTDNIYTYERRYFGGYIRVIQTRNYMKEIWLNPSLHVTAIVLSSRDCITFFKCIMNASKLILMLHQRVGKPANQIFEKEKFSGGKKENTNSGLQGMETT